MTSNSANEESELFYIRLFLLASLKQVEDKLELLQKFGNFKEKELAIFKGLSKNEMKKSLCL